MQVSKEKICKCGHARSYHKAKPESKLSFPGECSRCKCSDYLNRRLPDKASKFAMFVGFFTLGLIVFGAISLYYTGYGIMNKPVTLTVGSLLTITIGLFVMVGVIIATNGGLFGYFTEKKRKEYPVE